MIGKGTLALAGAQAIVLVVTLTLALDMYVHKRFEGFGGVNYWGYKGPVAGLKQPNAVRIVIVGGTRAFGWGVPASALVTELRRTVMLSTDQRGRELRPIEVINLGRLGAVAESYPAILDRYAYLEPDYIVLYDDLGTRGGDPALARSGLFALTGYAPALPLMLREKGAVWRTGDVRGAYEPASAGAGTVPVARRIAGTIAERSGAALAAADRVLASHVRPAEDGPAPSGEGYAAAMMAAIDAAHRHTRGVVVAVSPADTREQDINLRRLKARLALEAGSTPWLRFVDLGMVAALHDGAIRLDGWNFSSDGTVQVATTIAPALIAFLEAGR